MPRRRRGVVWAVLGACFALRLDPTFISPRLSGAWLFVGLVCQSADLTTFEMMSHISESLTRRLCPCWTTERNVSLSKSIRVRSRRALSDDSSMLLGIVTEDTLHT